MFILDFQCDIGTLFCQSRIFEGLNPTCSQKNVPISEIEVTEQQIILKRCGLYQTADENKDAGISICKNHKAIILTFQEKYVKKNNTCVYPNHEGTRKKSSKSSVRMLGEPLARFLSLHDIIQA